MNEQIRTILAEDGTKTSKIRKLLRSDSPTVKLPIL